MKKLLFTIFTVSVLMSCSNDDNSSGNSNDLLSGQVFETYFMAQGGRADLDDETITIRYGFNGEGCETDDGSDLFRIEIKIPNTIGVHSGNGTFVAFNDGEGSFTVLFGESVEAEIFSLTDTTVDFRIEAEDSFFDDTNLNGRHQVNICD